jgi:lysozyme
MNLTHGVDVSRYEPNVDWRKLREQGFKFAIMKATESTNIVDPLFATHWAGARAEGILRGAYHYLHAGEDAGKQANLFISTVGSDQGELPPIVDLEDAANEDQSNSKIIASCKAILDLIEKSFGRKPIVYSRRNYMDQHMTINGKAPDWAKDYDLWLAQYPYKFDPAMHPNVNMPSQPPGWTKGWKFWQYSEHGIVDGITDNNRPTQVDLNWFNGTEAELRDYAKVKPVEDKTYTIKAGDTFKAIAESNNLTLIELLDANPALVQVGSILKIPGRGIIPIPIPIPDPIPNPVVTHKVTSTDTLSSIALKYRTTVDAIMKLNPQIIDKNRIYDGQIIVIS